MSIKNFRFAALLLGNLLALTLVGCGGQEPDDVFIPENGTAEVLVDDAIFPEEGKPEELEDSSLLCHRWVGHGLLMVRVRTGRDDGVACADAVVNVYSDQYLSFSPSSCSCPIE